MILECNYLQGVCGGVFRGLGRQGMLAKMTLFAFWGIGVPVGGGLCFGTSLGVFGLWWGLCTGLVVLSLVYIVMWARIDWGHEAEKALQSTQDFATGGGGGGGGDDGYGALN
jgi:MATE family multidrug resistance protein